LQYIGLAGNKGGCNYSLTHILLDFLDVT
jgi:hypothetical protein